MIKFSFSEPNISEGLNEIEEDALERGRLLLEMAGAETVAYLRSLTDRMQPPVRKAEGPRPAHPGNWADITGDLARGYGYTVDKGVDHVDLTLWNREDYAAALEAKDGYYVLSGVAEPGGPLDAAIREAAPRIGLEVR